MAKSKKKPELGNEQPEVGELAGLTSEVAGAIENALWSEAARELRATRFDSVEAALYALIDRVLEKMQATVQPQPGLRDFLFEVLNSDPELKEDLKRLLNV